MRAGETTSVAVIDRLQTPRALRERPGQRKAQRLRISRQGHRFAFADLRRLHHRPIRAGRRRREGRPSPIPGQRQADRLPIRAVRAANTPARCPDDTQSESMSRTIASRTASIHGPWRFSASVTAAEAEALAAGRAPAALAGRRWNARPRRTVAKTEIDTIVEDPTCMLAIRPTFPTPAPAAKAYSTRRLVHPPV